MTTRLIILILLILDVSFIYAQSGDINHMKIEEDLHQMLDDLAGAYVYQEDKGVDLDCLRSYYQSQIRHIQTEEESVLFFEYLLDELYDSHVMLNTNRKSSYRLYAPIYATLKDGRPIVSEVWQSQIDNIGTEIIGSEILRINGVEIDEAIDRFPTHCHDKDKEEVREWLINKILAGRYNESRVLTLRLSTGDQVQFDLDGLKMRQEVGLLTSSIEDSIGIIRIHNSLGDNALIQAFDQSLDALMHTKGLILDLRNTVGGGNSYVARGIMGRMIAEPKPYQKHQYMEHYDGHTAIERSWVEYVSPRGEIYHQPVVVLVGRWTGSMGEGLAIGLDGMDRASVLGTEMERLAGEMNVFAFAHRNYGYRLSVARLYHVDGTPRESYVPPHYVHQTTVHEDETLAEGMEYLRRIMR